MPKSTFIPNADHDFLAWFDHFLANLKPEHGVADADLAALTAANADFHDKSRLAGNAAALAKQATADKSDSRKASENLIRAEVRRIKARANYTDGIGAQLGIDSSSRTGDLSTANPKLSGNDQTGGVVVLSFVKHRSDGVNLYCQRDIDSDWVLLGRATVSPCVDRRPLLTPGKPELRRYTAVFMSKDQEVGQYSQELVVNCAP
ncbi:hypothetical protein [Methylomonas sp. 2B]|uniref:hypothetical protein n=1 Tax=Methylomonas sp. 2B TaxID=3367743 RepID=UPI0037CC75BF